jgi:hypothetical protein
MRPKSQRPQCWLCCCYGTRQALLQRWRQTWGYWKADSCPHHWCRLYQHLLETTQTKVAHERSQTRVGDTAVLELHVLVTSFASCLGYLRLVPRCAHFS